MIQGKRKRKLIKTKAITGNRYYQEQKYLLENTFSPFQFCIPSSSWRLRTADTEPHLHSYWH